MLTSTTLLERLDYLKTQHIQEIRRADALEIELKKTKTELERLKLLVCKCNQRKGKNRNGRNTH